MKKAILAVAMAFVASTASASIATTPHDLTGGSTAGAGACQYCHMPHNANTSVTAAPIWSRSISTSASYTFKAGSTANLDTTQYSLLCLSCHDGTTAMGMLWNGQQIGSQTAIPSTSTNYIGTVLSNDHPVGVVYPSAGTAATSTGLVPLATAQSRGFVVFGASGNLECGSCHDPHDNTNGFFKRTLVGATDFCVACHGLK